MIAFNILAKREFHGNGKHHKVYNKIGHIKYTENGNTYLQLFHLPNIDFLVIPNESTHDSKSFKITDISSD